MKRGLAATGGLNSLQMVAEQQAGGSAAEGGGGEPRALTVHMLHGLHISTELQ